MSIILISGVTITFKNGLYFLEEIRDILNEISNLEIKYIIADDYSPDINENTVAQFLEKDPIFGHA